MMKLLVTVNKLNRRRSVPANFSVPNIVGTVSKGYRFEGEEVDNVNPATGKWYHGADGYYYWGGGLIVESYTVPSPTLISYKHGLSNLPDGYSLCADLSHHNETPDWKAMHDAGVTSVYLKISEGVGTRDQKVQEHAANALRYGMKTGYYHFCRPDLRNGGTVISDAKAEAHEALSVLQQLTSYLPLALDLEDQQHWDTPLSDDDYELWAHTFIDEIKMHVTGDPIIYSRSSYLDKHLPANHQLHKYKLWLARYGITDAKKLTMPKGWNNWQMWQFTESAVIGGNKKLDLSIVKP